MYILSQAAAMDVENILERSKIDFGLLQTEQYYLSLKRCLELLASNPGMGTRADDLHTEYYRFPHRSHVIFYTASEKHIFIIRILHQSMDIAEHLDELR